MICNKKSKNKSRMGRKPGTIKIVKIATRQESTDTSFNTQQYLQLSKNQGKQLKKLFYDTKFSEDDIFAEMQIIINSLLKKNDFLIKDRSNLLKQNFQLKRLLQEYKIQDLQISKKLSKINSNQNFSEELMSKIKSIQKQTQQYMINSLQGKLDFFTLSKVASRNKIFLEGPLQSYRSEAQQNLFNNPNTNLYQRFQSWENSFHQKIQDNQNSYESYQSSQVKLFKDQRAVKVQNVQEKESFILIRSGDSGQASDKESSINSKKQDYYYQKISQTNYASKVQKRSQFSENNRINQNNINQSYLDEKYIPQSSEKNNLIKSKQSYKCYQHLQIKPKDSFSISQINDDYQRYQAGLIQLQNCEYLTSLMASQQIVQEQISETPRNTNHKFLFDYLTSGDQNYSQKDRYCMPMMQTPTLDQNFKNGIHNQMQTFSNQNNYNYQQYIYQQNYHSNMVYSNNQNMRKSVQQNVIRCPSSSKFAPLRCFYICMFNNKSLVEHFMKLLNQFRGNQNQVINQLYRDNKLWIQVAAKFVKDYWRGTLYNQNETQRCLMQNNLSAASLMRYIDENKLTDIAMIGVLKARLHYIFDSKTNSYTEGDHQEKNKCFSQSIYYSTEEIFGALANQFDLQLIKSEDQYKFYLITQETSRNNSENDSYLLSSNNQYTNQDKLHNLKIQNQNANKEQEIKPLFTIYHRKDLSIYQFYLPKNQISKQDMKFMKKKFIQKQKFISQTSSQSESISYQFKNSQNLSQKYYKINTRQSQYINQKQSRNNKFITKEQRGQSQIQLECSSISQCPLSINNKTERILLFDSVTPSANKYKIQFTPIQSQDNISNFGHSKYKQKDQQNYTQKIRNPLKQISLRYNNNNFYQNNSLQYSDNRNFNTQEDFKYQIFNESDISSYQQKSNKNKPFIPPLNLGGKKQMIMMNLISKARSNQNTQQKQNNQNNKFNLSMNRPPSNRFQSVEQSFMAVNLDSKRNNLDSKRNINQSYSFDQKDANNLQFKEEQFDIKSQIKQLRQ